MNDPQSPGPTAASAVGTPPPDTSPVAVPVNSEGQTDYSMSGSLVQADIDTTVGIVGATTPTPASVGVARSLSPVKKHSKKKLGIVLAAVIIGLGGLFGGGAFAYTTYQKPENVLLHAASNLLDSKQLRTKTTITSNYAYGEGDEKLTLGKLVYETGLSDAPSVDTNAELTVRYGKKDITLKADVLVTDAGDAYFKVTGAKNAIKSALGSMITMSQSAEDILDKIDGKWAKYTLDALKQDSPETGKIAQCMLDVYKKHKNDSKASDELVAAYKNNQFVVADGELQQTDDKVGYPVAISKDKLKSFLLTSEKGTVAKELSACDPDHSELTNERAEGIAYSYTANEHQHISTTLWIAKYTHKLQAVDVKVQWTYDTDNGSNKATTTSIHIDIMDNVGVTTQVPSDTMTAKQWVGYAGDFYNEVAASEDLLSATNNDGIENNIGMVSSAAITYASYNRGRYPASAEVLVQAGYLPDEYGFTLVSRLPANHTEIGYQLCTDGPWVLWRADDGAYKARNPKTDAERSVTTVCG